MSKSEKAPPTHDYEKWMKIGEQTGEHLLGMKVLSLATAIQHAQSKDLTSQYILVNMLINMMTDIQGVYLITDQDTTDARRFFTRRLEAIDRKEKEDCRNAAARSERLAFAAKWNAFLERETPFNQDGFTAAAKGRTSDLDGPSYYRAERHRGDYAALPSGTMPYYQFCKVDLIDLNTII